MECITGSDKGYQGYGNTGSPQNLLATKPPTRLFGLIQPYDPPSYNTHYGGSKGSRPARPGGLLICDGGRVRSPISPTGQPTSYKGIWRWKESTQGQNNPATVGGIYQRMISRAGTTLMMSKRGEAVRGRAAAPI
jgi:hypothetical protein